MSLPPVQSPLPEVQKKTQPVKKPEATHNQDDRAFKGSMSSAQKERADEQKTSNDRRTDKQAAKGDAPDGGKELPPEETETNAEIASNGPAPVAADPNIVILDLGGTALDPAETDQALLLAASFAMDTLPRTAKDASAELTLSSNLSGAKPDVLARLQSLTGQLTAPLAPTRQVADGLTLEGMQAETITNLTKASPVTSQANAETLEALATQSNNLDAKVQATTARTELVVPNRVGGTDWGEAMAGRITLMVNQKISSARIHINPPELGPIEVRVNLNHDQASVQFTSQSAQVRDALEQSIPRLRDMLENAGFSLADSGVNDQPQNGSGESGDERGNGDQHASDEQTAQLVSRETLGLVDDYV